MRCALILLVLLAGFAEASEPKEQRELPVTLVTDSSFRELNAWRGRAKGAIERATQDLADSLELYFHITGEASWEPPDGVASLEEALDLAMREFADTPGLLAVFIGDRLLEDDSRPQVGYAYLGHPALIITGSRSFRLRVGQSVNDHLAWTFRHELGHVFGVPHLKVPCIMNPVHEERTWEFSPVSWDILRAARNLDFTSDRPFAGCDLDVLRDAYLALARAGSLESATVVNLGAAFYNAGRPAEALDLFLRARDMGDASVPGLLGLAQCALDTGDTASARAAVRALPAADLTGAQVALAGTLLRRLGDTGTGMTLLNRAVEETPKRFGAWFQRGLLHFSAERYEAARADFTRALELEDRPEAWFNLGLCCDALEDTACARTAFETVLDRYPEHIRAPDAAEFLERLTARGR